MTTPEDDATVVVNGAAYSMSETTQLIENERSIRRLESRMNAEISEIRKELTALRSSQWRAEGRANHNTFLADMRNNFRWVMAAIGMFAYTIVFAIIVAAIVR